MTVKELKALLNHFNDEEQIFFTPSISKRIYTPQTVDIKKTCLYVGDCKKAVVIKSVVEGFYE